MIAYVSWACVRLNLVCGIEPPSSGIVLLTSRASHELVLKCAIAGIELKSDKEAYRVQDAVFADLWPGARPAAWKAGAPASPRPSSRPRRPRRNAGTGN